MVKGIESFRKKFMDYRDCYTVIGGAACDILMSEEDLSFRATKDIDMIILLEDRFQEFAKSHVPMQRYGRAGELDAALLFLASKEASYVTGVNGAGWGATAAKSGDTISWT